MKKILSITALILLVSCAQNKTAVTANVKASQTESTKTTKIVEGVVIEIITGKDGYTAKLKSHIDALFFTTISRANLKDPTQYKTVAIGDKLKVSGDFWQMENENHITVRQIL